MTSDRIPLDRATRVVDRSSWARLSSRVAAAATVMWVGASGAVAQLPGARVPGGCDVPVAERTSEVGCYLITAQPLGALPAGPLYWHLYTYPTRRAAAEAAARITASADASAHTVVESFGKVWLFALARADWRPRRGARVAAIGPLPVPPAPRYVARYMEARFPPGMQTSVHRHSGPEAWYVVSGAQCLQTPDSTIIARAGRGAVVPAGPPMRLSGLGAETRRSLVLVLHDASQPWMAITTDWTPDRAC